MPYAPNVIAIAVTSAADTTPDPSATLVPWQADGLGHDLLRDDAQHGAPDIAKQNHAGQRGEPSGHSVIARNDVAEDTRMAAQDRRRSLAA